MIFTSVLIPAAVVLFGLGFMAKGRLKLYLWIGAAGAIIAWIAIGFLKGWS